MSLFLNYGSRWVDSAYRAIKPDKTCGLKLEIDFFDEKEFTTDSFFDWSRQFFDKPELFFTSGTAVENCQVFKTARNEKEHYDFYKYSSPFSTQWHENSDAYFKHFSNDAKSDTILIFTPGWARSALKPEIRFCQNLLSKGIDSALVIKPFHQNRTPNGYYSGELFISGNIFLTAMNFRQLVSEIQYLINFYRQQYKYVGLIGMSSGGFQSGLAADVAEVDYYFPIITGATLGSIMWESKLATFLKNDIQRKGIHEFDLNRAWAISDQEYLGHNCKARNIKQFISLYDEIIPTKYQYRLWEIYNKPEYTELHCAHSTVVFFFDKIVKEIVSFINENK